MSCAQATNSDLLQLPPLLYSRQKLSKTMYTKQMHCQTDVLPETVHLTVTTQPYYDYTKRKCFHIAHVPP